MNTVILVSSGAIALSFMAGYVRGFWAGRKDAQEEAASKILNDIRRGFSSTDCTQD